MSREITLAALHRILKNAGAERVRKSALIEYQRLIEDISSVIARLIVEICERHGRSMILAEDILAVRRIIYGVGRGIFNTKVRPTGENIANTK